MAKMKESIVSVVNTENGKKVEARSTQTPRKNEAGVYAVPKMNILGFAYAQQKYPELTDTKAFEKKLGELFGIPEQGFGSLGNWVTEEDRTRLQVLIDGQPFMPPIKPVATVPAPAPMEAIAPPVVPTLQPITAMGDTTIPSKDEKNIQALLGALRGGHDQKAVQEALIAKLGQVKATEIWTKAAEIAQQQPVAPTAPVAPQLQPQPIVVEAPATPAFDLGL